MTSAEPEVLDALRAIGARVVHRSAGIEAQWKGLPVRVSARDLDSVDAASRLLRCAERLSDLPDPVATVEIHLTRSDAFGVSPIRVPMVRREQAESILELSGDPFLVYFDRDRSAMTILGLSSEAARSHVAVEHHLPQVSIETHTTGAERGARRDLPDLVITDVKRRARKFARLRPMLRCVRCADRAELIDRGAALECVSCGSAYPLRNGVPILFVDPAREGEPECDAVSSNGYSRQAIAMFDSMRDGFVLDCGCGSPSENLENVIHLEVTRYSNVDIVASCDRLPFADGVFEGVVCESVLEHVPDPRVVVEEFDRVLESGGRLFVDVPFLAPYHGFPAHYQNFTDSGLAALLGRFEKLEAGIHPHQEPWVAIGWILRCAREGLPNDELRATFDSAKLCDLLGAVALGAPPAWLHPLSDSARRTIAAGSFFYGKKP